MVHGTYFSHSLYLQTASVLRLICNSKFNTHGMPVTVCKHKQKNKTKIKPHPGHLFPAEVNGMVVGGRPELGVGCLPRCVIPPPKQQQPRNTTSKALPWCPFHVARCYVLVLLAGSWMLLSLYIVDALLFLNRRKLRSVPGRHLLVPAR